MRLRRWLSIHRSIRSSQGFRVAALDELDRRALSDSRLELDRGDSALDDMGKAHLTRTARENMSKNMCNKKSALSVAPSRPVLSRLWFRRARVPNCAT